MAKKQQTVTPKAEISVMEAMKKLASVCDGAVDIDGVGFSKVDTNAHNIIAHYEELTYQQEIEWYDRIKKYFKTQLGSYKVVDPRPKNEQDEARIIARQKHQDKVHAKDKSIMLLSSGIQINFGYNPNIVLGVKEIPGRKWDGDSKSWLIPISSAEAVLKFAEEYEFKNIDPRIALIKPKKEEAKFDKLIEKVGSKISIAFTYDKKLVEEVKKIVGIKFEGRKIRWEFTLSVQNYNLVEPQICNLVKNHKFLLSVEAREEFKKIKALIKNSSSNKELSKSQESNFKVKTLKKPFKPFQISGIEYGIKNDRALLGDDRGLGKTVQALGMTETKESFPALVVCPSNALHVWSNHVRDWTDHTSVLVTTDTPANTVADYYIINYDILHKVEWLKNIPFKTIISDESHYIKNEKTIRSKAVLSFCEVIPFKVLITGTVTMNRPIELVPQLQALGVLDSYFGGFWNFVTKYCDAKKTPYGWDFKGAGSPEALMELHQKLRECCYIRREKSEVLKELDEKQYSYVEVDIKNRKEYDLAYNDLLAYFDSKEAEVENIGNALDLEEFNRNFNGAEELARINYCKKIAAEGKMDDAIEWIESFLESGNKLVVFAFSTKLIDKLAKHFNCPKIDGTTSPKKRNEIENSFQTDPNTKLVIINRVAGRESLTLTAASDVLFLEYGWTPGDIDQCADRVHRIGQEGSVTVWFFVARNTIEKEILDLIEQKRGVTSIINSGVKQTLEVVTSVFSDLVKSLRAKSKTR